MSTTYGHPSSSAAKPLYRGRFPEMSAFLALLTSLPSGNSTTRMRLWRALRQTGCGVLRDGVYVLPSSAPQAAGLAEVEAQVRAAGGSAMTVEMRPRTPGEIEQVRGLFDRTKEYGEIVAGMASARPGLARMGSRKADTLVRRFRRSLEELSAIDFYPGPARPQAAEALAALEAEARRLSAPDEPHPAKGKVRKLDPARYRNRTWVSRKDLWVDRLASAWLIKRFIDTGAKFLWADRPASRRRGAIGFDFDGAEFTHVGGRVTYEVLLASFGLDEDPALAAIGQVVHFLDVGGIPAADAKGLETMLRGIKSTARNDDRLFAEAGKVFDSFYSAYAQPS
jgi:hypothetical protein